MMLLSKLYREMQRRAEQRARLAFAESGVLSTGYLIATNDADKYAHLAKEEKLSEERAKEIRDSKLEERASLAWKGE